MDSKYSVTVFDISIKNDKPRSVNYIRNIKAMEKAMCALCAPSPWPWTYLSPWLCSQTIEYQLPDSPEPVSRWQG